MTKLYNIYNNDNSNNSNNNNNNNSNSNSQKEDREDTPLDILLRIEEEVEIEKSIEYIDAGYIPEEYIELDGERLELVELGNYMLLKVLLSIIIEFEISS